MIPHQFSKPKSLQSLEIHYLYYDRRAFYCPTDTQTSNKLVVSVAGEHHKGSTDPKRALAKHLKNSKRKILICLEKYPGIS